jgi:thiamine kinase-like enzyme
MDSTDNTFLLRNKTHFVSEIQNKEYPIYTTCDIILPSSHIFSLNKFHKSEIYEGNELIAHSSSKIGEIKYQIIDGNVYVHQYPTNFSFVDWCVYIHKKSQLNKLHLQFIRGQYVNTIFHSTTYDMMA